MLNNLVMSILHNFQSAEKSFKFYNKHQFQMDSKTYSLQFESLKSVNTELKNQPKLTIKDIGKFLRPRLSPD